MGFKAPLPGIFLVGAPSVWFLQRTAQMSEELQQRQIVTLAYYIIDLMEGKKGQNA